MRLRKNIAIVACVLFVVSLACYSLTHLAFSRRSRPEDVAKSQKIVLIAVQTLKDRLQAGLPLPANTNELALALGGNIPRDAWGQPLRYQRFGLSNFVLSTMSPFPELLIINYDSRLTNSQLATYPF
jgi:hypothetical protein